MKFYYRLRKRIREWRRVTRRRMLSKIGKGGPSYTLNIDDVHSVITGGLVRDKED